MPDEVTLRELLEQRLDSIESRIVETFAAHAQIHDVAAHDIDRRLGEMNMLRRQIESERGQYMSRAQVEDLINAQKAEYQGLAHSNAGRIGILEKDAANLTGRMWALGSALMVAIALVGLAVKWL